MIFLCNASCLLAAERFVVVAIDKTLFINVYLPCVSADSDEIILAILDEIRSIISLYSDYSIVMGGDFNIDLPAKCKRSILITEFMKELNMSLALASIS